MYKEGWLVCDAQLYKTENKTHTKNHKSKTQPHPTPSQPIRAAHPEFYVQDHDRRKSKDTRVYTQDSIPVTQKDPST
jgi:hypothetical protein